MKPILMPRFDPEMKSGRVLEWLKREGEPVRKGEPVVRIDTEKVSLDVEAPESGTLGKILVHPPEEVPVGTSLGSILAEGETQGQQAAVSAPENALSEPLEKEPVLQESAAAPRGERPDSVRASPSARRVARELGVDLSSIRGSGPAGRIVSADVERARSAPRTVAPLPATVEARAATTPAAAQAEYTAKPLDPMRLQIAEKMVESWTRVPQVPLFAEVDLTETEKFRASMEKMLGQKVSLTAVVAKSLASALRSFPDLNARFEAGEVRVYEDVDIGIAVALDNGLVAPVLRRANRKTATEITREIEDLAVRARSGRLSLHEVHGGTTTVSNLSSYGVDYFIPLINPPQVSILGVGRVATAPRENPVCTVTFVFDHRVTDGARAAQVLQKIKEYMESPYLLQMA